MGTLLLLITALIWGSAFLFQKVGGDAVGPFAFTMGRNVLAALFLLGVMAARRRFRFGRAELVGGFWCGLALWVPSMLQQIGIADTSPGTCAFLTANYALIVPLFALALGRKPAWYVWPGIACALAGTFLICLKGAGEFAFGRGEALTLLCAAFFAVQILTVDHFIARADALGLSCIQFATGAVLGLPFLALPSEAAHLNLADFRTAAVSIVFCGVFSSGVAYTLQNVGQKLVAPAIAGIVMSLESVFGVFFGWLGWRIGWLALPEEMTPRRLVGYGLVFAAIVFTQLLDARKTEQKAQEQPR